MKYKNTMSTLNILCVASLLNAPLAFATNTNNMQTSDSMTKQPITKQAESKQTATDEAKSFEHIVKLTPEDFRPAFSRDTVIKLNKIVKRSYAVISEFDSLNKELETTISKINTDTKSSDISSVEREQLTAIKGLNQRSKAALNDLMEAVDTLKTSKEYYNSAVLAGMLKFVKTVDQEINDHSIFLAKLMKS